MNQADHHPPPTQKTFNDDNKTHTQNTITRQSSSNLMVLIIDFSFFDNFEIMHGDLSHLQLSSSSWQFISLEIPHVGP
ncbi:hypothetical protein TMEN_2286 [Trichophyton mentagrophytes]|nr:hypothetical protein TMEN_2286 [Trichophyton mentagrophytes]